MGTIIKLVATVIIGQWVAGIVLAFMRPSGILATVMDFAIIGIVGGIIFGSIKLGGTSAPKRTEGSAAPEASTPAQQSMDPYTPAQEWRDKENDRRGREGQDPV